MIFFLTTIIPSSNVEAEVKKQKSLLLRSNQIITLPITLIPVSITTTQPVRKTRKEIAATFPEKLTPLKPQMKDNHLIVPIEEKLSLHIDEPLKSLSPLFPNSIYYGQLQKNEGQRDSLELSTLPFFRNYSLAIFKIDCASVSSWNRAFSWEKIQEVKKGK